MKEFAQRGEMMNIREIKRLKAPNATSLRIKIKTIQNLFQIERATEEIAIRFEFSLDEKTTSENIMIKP